MMVLKYLLIVCVIQLINAQTPTEYVVYTDAKINSVTQFERELIQQIFVLKNKKTKQNHQIKFVEVDRFQDFFTYTEKNNTNQNKHISLGINEISFSNDRLKKYDLSLPYMTNFLTVLGKKDVAKYDDHKSFKKGIRYGLIKGSIFVKVLQELPNYQQLSVKEYNNSNDLKVAIDKNEIDLIFSDYTDGWALNLKPIFTYDAVKEDRFCILLPKGSKLTQEINSYLGYYLQSPSFFKLVKKHFGKEAVNFFKKSVI